MKAFPRDRGFLRPRSERDATETPRVIFLEHRHRERRREQVGHRQANRSKHGVNRTTGMTPQQYSSVVARADRQRSPAVFVGGTTGFPLPVAGRTNAVEPREQFCDVRAIAVFGDLCKHIHYQFHACPVGSQPPGFFCEFCSLVCANGCLDQAGLLKPPFGFWRPLIFPSVSFDRGRILGVDKPRNGSGACIKSAPNFLCGQLHANIPDFDATIAPPPDGRRGGTMPQSTFQEWKKQLTFKH